MSDNLSEISHLFLSSIRERGGAVRPQRTPPAKSVEPIEAPVTVPITAILAAHFGAEQPRRVLQYARHLAAGSRIGMIEADAAAFRITCFDGSSGAMAGAPLEPADQLDPREVSQTLAELSCDVQRWLLVLVNPRAHEAKALLRNVEHWTLLCGSDPDGVVAAYRTLKGLAELGGPRLSLAVLDAADEKDAARVSDKLAGVCRQFLGWSIEPEAMVAPAPQVVESTALFAAAATPWEMIGDFVACAKCKENREQARRLNEETAPDSLPSPAPEQIEEPTPMPQVQPIGSDDVIDVPATAGESDILAAIIRHGGNELIECPVIPPMCAAAKLAVSRHRRLVLLAIAREGLVDLRAIGQAYRWLIENRALVCMALPQLAIDPHPLPELSLFVNQNDASADTLAPLLSSGHINVRAYRKLRWGEKTGVLLEAA